MTPERMRFDRRQLPVGDDKIPVLVASEGDKPKAVVMSYDAFLEIAATLYTAVEAMRAAGVDASILDASDDEDDEPARGRSATSAADVAEFEAWDDAFVQRPALRLVVGG